MMKKMLIMLALAASVTGAYAWDVTVPATNAAAVLVMAVPPALVEPYPQLAQLPVRATNLVVPAGAKYRIGNQVIVAAHAGTMTNSNETTYYTNGVLVSLAGAQYAATNSIAVTTNIVVAPITVPATGLSGYDGSVRWYRPRSLSSATLTENVRVQVVYGGSDTVRLTDRRGDGFSYTAAGFVDFLGYAGELYVSQDALGTNSVKVLAW